MQYVSLCVIYRGIALIPSLEFWSPSTENLHGTILVVTSREAKEITTLAVHVPGLSYHLCQQNLSLSYPVGVLHNYPRVKYLL